MRIIETFPDLELAVPKAARVLSDLNGVLTYESEYGARHPTAAYNVSLAAVFRRLSALLKQHERVLGERSFLNPKNLDWDLPLIDATDHFLDSLMEHIDDCGGILRSFFPNPEHSLFKTVLKDFKTSVEPYRKHTGALVNYLKHNQGRLRNVYFDWGGGAVLGYYVEGPSVDGALGPVKRFHPDEASAFSYNRDIQFHICSVFAVGARLAAALHAINRSFMVAKSAAPNSGQSTDLMSSLTAAASLSRVFFPDERIKLIPSVSLRNGVIRLEFPSARERISRPPSGSRVGVKFEGDGVTRKYRMPYLK